MPPLSQRKLNATKTTVLSLPLGPPGPDVDLPFPPSWLLLCPWLRLWTRDTILARVVAARDAARDSLGCGACDMKASAAIVKPRLLRAHLSVLVHSQNLPDRPVESFGQLYFSLNTAEIFGQLYSAFSLDNHADWTGLLDYSGNTDVGQQHTQHYSEIVHFWIKSNHRYFMCTFSK